MLVYDLDSVDREFLDNIADKIGNKGSFYTTYSHTPEHPRARMIIPVTRDMTPDEFNAAARYYAADNGFLDMLDLICSMDLITPSSLPEPIWKEQRPSAVR